MVPTPNKDDDAATGDSMRDDVESAIAAIESGDDKTKTIDTLPPEDADAKPAKSATPPQDEETGDKARGKPDEKTEPRADDPKPDADAKTDAPAADDVGKPDVKAEKAPAGWTPAERELWGELPPTVKARITKREGEISSALNEGVEHRKLGQRYDELTRKHQATFAAEGYADDPYKAINGLVEIVTAMRFGSPQDKVAHIARFIKNYNVDISQLDDLLVGAKATPETAQQDAMTRMLDERMAPVNKLLERLNGAQATQTQELNTKTADAVTDFSKTAEFIDDVRLDMADFMDMADKQNRPLTLQQAYDKACTMNPEISKVLAGRTEKARLLDSTTTIAAKKLAASSIQGDRSGAGGGNGDLSLRQEIEQGFGSG